MSVDSPFRNAPHTFLKVGDRVRTKVRIHEEGPGTDSFVHAEAGELGTVVFTEPYFWPTVRFDLSGSASCVSDFEVDGLAQYQESLDEFFRGLHASDRKLEPSMEGTPFAQGFKLAASYVDEAEVEKFIALVKLEVERLVVIHTPAPWDPEWGPEEDTAPLAKGDEAKLQYDTSWPGGGHVLRGTTVKVMDVYQAGPSQRSYLVSVVGEEMHYSLPERFLTKLK